MQFVMDHTKERMRKKKKSLSTPAVTRQSSLSVPPASAPAGDINGYLLLVSAVPPMRRRTFVRLRGAVLMLLRHADSEACDRHVILDAEVREHVGLLLSLRLPSPPLPPPTQSTDQEKRPLIPIERASRSQRRRSLALVACTADDKARWLAALRRASKFRLETRYTLSSPIAHGLYGTLHPVIDKQTPFTPPAPVSDSPTSSLSAHSCSTSRFSTARHANVSGPPATVTASRKLSHEPEDAYTATLAARIARPSDTLSADRLSACVAALHAMPPHARLLPVRHVFETPRDVSIVSEAPAISATLAVAVQSAGGLPEQLTRAIVSDLVSALAHMHTYGVAHGFVTPRAVLVDVHARVAWLGGLGGGLALGGGSCDAGAPERREGARKAVEATECAGIEKGAAGVPRTDDPVDTADMWDVGALTVFALTGGPPVFDEEGALLTVGSEWAGVSNEARRFVRMMMTRDPQARLTAVGALCHTWVTGAGVPVAERGTVADSESRESTRGGPKVMANAGGETDLVGDVVSAVDEVQVAQVVMAGSEAGRHTGRRSVKDVSLDVRDALRITRKLTRQSQRGVGNVYIVTGGDGDEGAKKGATEEADEWTKQRDWRDKGMPSSQCGRMNMVRAGGTEEEVNELWEHNSPTGDVSDLFEFVTR